MEYECDFSMNGVQSVRECENTITVIDKLTPSAKGCESSARTRLACRRARLDWRAHVGRHALQHSPLRLQLSGVRQGIRER